MQWMVQNSCRINFSSDVFRFRLVWVDPLSSVHTELFAIAMQKWVANFAKEWVEYPLLAMLANANSIANAQCERTLTLSTHLGLLDSFTG